MILIPENGETRVRRFIKTGNYKSGLSQGEVIDSLEITTVNLTQTTEISLTAELHVYNTVGKEVGGTLPINQVTGGESSYLLNQPGDGPYYIYIEYTTTNAKVLQLRMNLTIGIVDLPQFTLTETTFNSEDAQLKKSGPIILTGEVTSPDGIVTLTATKNETPVTLTINTTPTGLTWTLNTYTYKTAYMCMYSPQQTRHLMF